MEAKKKGSEDVQKAEIQSNAVLHINQFPESLHPLLKEVDDEGNGYLETDELTEVFTMYCDLKKSHKDGSIAISTLPKELQPTLKVFDVDSDGSVAPLELARAAELYKNSKNNVQRLVKAVAVLLIVLLVLVGSIVGLVAVVIEESKETETSGSGVTTVKGGSAVVTTGECPSSARRPTRFNSKESLVPPRRGVRITTSQASVFDAVTFTQTQLKQVTQLDFTIPNGFVLYTISGAISTTVDSKPQVTFYTSNGGSIEVTENNVKVVDPKSGLNFEETRAQTVRTRTHHHEPADRT
eukprot:6561046-Pyramimonas_sp.AAC.1